MTCSYLPLLSPTDIDECTGTSPPCSANAVCTNTEGSYDLKVTVKGGGSNGQAEAVRLAIARALCNINEEHRAELKPEGLLTRDPRMVERKKFGQKKARKKFQFSKR